MVNYATVETRTAYMSTEFAVTYATRLFGQKVVSSLPQISRGKRKGSLKGILEWSKCTRGGWVKGVGVYVPGFIKASINVDGKIVASTFHPNFELKIQSDLKDLASKLQTTEDYKARTEKKISALQKIISSEGESMTDELLNGFKQDLADFSYDLKVYENEVANIKNKMAEISG